MGNTTYYEILGVGQMASQEEIKSAYRALSKKYHPDLNDASNANAMFRLICEAYETLSSPERRQQYDQPVAQPIYSQDEAHDNLQDLIDQFNKRAREEAAQRPPPTPLKIFFRVLGKILCLPLYPIVCILCLVVKLCELGGMWLAPIVGGLSTLGVLLELLSGTFNWAANWTFYLALIVVTALLFVASLLSSLLARYLSDFKNSICFFFSRPLRSR